MGIDAERAVLCCILLNPKDSYPVALEKLGRIEAPFSNPEHQTLWDEMKALDADGKPITVELLSLGYNTPVLVEILSKVPVSANIQHYCDAVLSEAIHRHIADTVDEAARQFKGGKAGTAQIADMLGQKLNDIVLDSTTKTRILDAKDAATQLLARTQSMIDRGADLSGVPTGIRPLDSILFGMQPEDMVVLAARPSIGKTALALQIMRHVTMAAKMPCLMFSLEMSTETLMMRHAQATDALLTDRLRSGWQAKGELQKLESAANRWNGTLCRIADVPGITAPHMRNIARRFRSTHGNQLGIIMIDYMQLMSGDKRHPREAQVADISRNIKALAREMRWPVLALSQLNRSVDESHEPQLSNLRESGAIEQDADVVMLMHRPKQEDSEHWVTVRVAKHRNGPLGLVTLWFDKTRQIFSESKDFHEPQQAGYIPAETKEPYEEEWGF